MFLTPQIENNITAPQRFIIFEILGANGPLPACKLNEGLRLEFGFSAIQAARAIKKAIDQKMVIVMPSAELDVHANILS